MNAQTMNTQTTQTAASKTTENDLREIAQKVQDDNPSLDIRYNDKCVVYVHNGIIGMIASVFILTGEIVTMFDRPLNLSANGAKAEDFTPATI